MQRAIRSSSGVHLHSGSVTEIQNFKIRFQIFALHDNFEENLLFFNTYVSNDLINLIS